MTDDLDADIARILARHRRRQRLGWTDYNDHPHGITPKPATRPQRDLARPGRLPESRAARYQGDAAIHAIELDLTLAFAHTGLTIRGAA